MHTIDKKKWFQIIKEKRKSC